MSQVSRHLQTQNATNKSQVTNVVGQSASANTKCNKNKSQVTNVVGQSASVHAKQRNTRVKGNQSSVGIKKTARVAFAFFFIYLTSSFRGKRKWQPELVRAIVHTVAAGSRVLNHSTSIQSLTQKYGIVILQISWQPMQALHSFAQRLSVTRCKTTFSNGPLASFLKETALIKENAQLYVRVVLCCRPSSGLYNGAPHICLGPQLGGNSPPL